MKNIPEKIYLQIGEDCPDDVDFKELLIRGISWWPEKMNENDIEYVRADKHSKFKPLTEDKLMEVSDKYTGFELSKELTEKYPDGVTAAQFLNFLNERNE